MRILHSFTPASNPAARLQDRNDHSPHDPRHIVEAADRIDEHAPYPWQTWAVPKRGRVGRFAAMRFGKATAGRLRIMQSVNALDNTEES